MILQTTISTFFFNAIFFLISITYTTNLLKHYPFYLIFISIIELAVLNPKNNDSIV